MKVNLNNTLEELENDKWGTAPENSTRLVTTILELRKKPLKDFTVEDLRITIGQSFSLEFLIPLAIEELKKNILAEGNFFEGDLLMNVLNADINYWKQHYDHWLTIKTLFDSYNQLDEEKKDKQILKNFKRFEEIYK